MTESRPPPEPTTAEGLRAAIDRGLTGDKVPGSDPAAAPLGTDAEAGGTPPSAAEIALEARSRPLPPPERAGVPPRVWLWAGGIVLVLLVVLALAWTV